MADKPAVPSGLTAPERETVIQWDDERDTVLICTSQAPVARKLARCGAVLVRESVRGDSSVSSQTFSAQKADFRWSIRPKRVLTEEQRLKRAAALAKAREKQP